ncbi:MAG: CofH family radical SAM protein [Rikenellaceae bacterium]
MKIDKILDSAIKGERISCSDALTLYKEAPLSFLSQASSEIKRAKTGNDVFYNINFHIEPTNICIFKCKFCSYRKPATSPEAWDYSLEEIFEQAKAQQDKNVTEVHIVGGVHPEHDLYYYAKMISGIKEILPKVTIKAFSAIELAYMIEQANLSYSEGLQLLKNAGMQTLPGGGAEIFDEEIRAQICPDKGSTKQWLELHESAHRLDISTNATMLYGHIESIEHRIDHLNRLRELQDKTQGFNAFIPLKYRNFGNELSSRGEVSITEDMRMIAISRIFLDNFNHIKAYWPMFGKTTTELALAFGADDIDGTIDDSTKIYSMAGAEDTKPSMSVSDIKRIIENAGYKAVERDSFYNPIIR